MADQPGYTRTPNALFDALPELSEVKLKLVLHIIRKTIGWGKDTDPISLTQFEQATDLSRPAIVEALKELLDQGWIAAAGRGKWGTPNWQCGPRLVNSVNQLTQATGSLSLPDSVNSVNQNGANLVNSVNPQKKESKEKKESDSAARVTRQRTTRENKEPVPEIVITTLADVCKIDRAVATKTQRDQLYQSAGILARAGAKQDQAPEQIAEAIEYVAGYFRHKDWRGKKGQSPTPAVIREMWREAIDARATNGNGHRNGKQPVRSHNAHDPHWQGATETDLDRGF